MACNCVNDEGYPSMDCDGTCSSSRMINPHKQERAMEDSFTPNQLQQVKSIVREALSVSPMLARAWQEGFIMGFKEGVDYGN